MSYDEKRERHIRSSIVMGAWRPTVCQRPQLVFGGEGR